MSRRKTIGLVMLVRDEADTIRGCLASVVKSIDTWTIIDTGSRDDTPAIVEEMLASKPGQLLHRPWRDFGHNRTELLAEAHGSADYLLMLDADHILHRHAQLPKLIADEYLIRQEGGFDAALPLLIRGDVEWEYRGRAHAYLEPADGRPTSRVDLAEWTIEAREDGRVRVDKFKRDRQLLARSLRENPADTRSLFYLAQTHRDLGHKRKALKLYRQRARMGGFDEEVFWAAYQASILSGDVAEMLAAHELRPTRAEPLYLLAKTHREAGQPAAALMYAERGLALPYPTDRLFVIRSVYEWMLPLEACHCLIALGRHDEAIPCLAEMARNDGPAREYAKNTLAALPQTLSLVEAA